MSSPSLPEWAQAILYVTLYTLATLASSFVAQGWIQDSKEGGGGQNTIVCMSDNLAKHYYPITMGHVDVRSS